MKLPVLRRNADGYSVHLTDDSLPAGFVATGNNMDGWGWTVGLGWHTGLPTVGAALDALLADPALGVDVHNEGRRVLVGGPGPASDGRSVLPCCDGRVTHGHIGCVWPTGTGEPATECLYGSDCGGGRSRPCWSPKRDTLASDVEAGRHDQPHP